MAKKRKRHQRAAPSRAARAARRVKPSTRRAIIAAYLSKRSRKAARTRAKGTKKEKKKLPVEAVGELVLFEANADDSPPAFVDWGQFDPPVGGRWRVRIELRVEGTVVETADLEVPEPAGGFDWDAGAVPVQVRNVIRAWYETWRAAHPDQQSPQAGMLRIAVVR